jgi:hypothetical protein
MIRRGSLIDIEFTKKKTVIPMHFHIFHRNGRIICEFRETGSSIKEPQREQLVIIGDMKKV